MSEACKLWQTQLADGGYYTAKVDGRFGPVSLGASRVAAGWDAESVLPAAPISGELSGFTFGRSSERELIGVKPELVKVVRECLLYSPVDFAVFDGLRTKAEQLAMVESGASKTMNSRHLTGDAVDLVPVISGRLRWDWGACRKIAVVMKDTAIRHGVRITWGGDWAGFPDGAHYQLSWPSG